MTAVDGTDVHFHGDKPAAAARDALHDRRELTFVAVERTRMPMVITNPRLPDNPIVLANAAFLTSTGYTAEEVIGWNCRFLQGSDTDRSTVDEVRGDVEEGRETTRELLNYRKDGTPFWNRLFISPVLDDAGDLIYFFASQLDVTEERRAKELEAAEQLLLREIEHRAKNSLALVQGIVRLSRAASVDEFADLVQGRVDALSNAHVILANGRWRDVPLERLISIETESLGGRVALTGPFVEITSAQVQPLALVVHEVVANATRFGGLSVALGSLSITWKLDDGNIVIEMDERDGPPIPEIRVPGFGTRMIRTIVERQLRGSVQYDWDALGLKTAITIPDYTVGR
ncbi:MAG: PAS domain-containing protein [Janthinobacterium lividum]